MQPVDANRRKTAIMLSRWREKQGQEMARPRPPWMMLHRRKASQLLTCMLNYFSP